MQEGFFYFQKMMGLVTTRHFGNFSFLGRVKKGEAIKDEEAALLLSLTSIMNLGNGQIFIPHFAKNAGDKARVVIVDDSTKAYNFSSRYSSNFFKLEEEGDAVIVLNPSGRGLLFYTADCPIVFLEVRHGDKGKSALVGIHAGWRGLTQGIIPRVLRYLRKMEYSSSNSNIWVNIAPHLGFCCAEYSKEVFELFFKRWPLHLYPHCYQANGENFKVNFLEIIREVMSSYFQQYPEVFPYCTACNAHQFFSYRKEKPKLGEENVGRFAALVLSRDYYTHL